MINLNFLIYKLYRPTESESWEERWDLFLDVSQVDDLGLGTTEQYRRLFKPWILSTWYSRKLSWKPGFVAVQLWEKHLSVSELHTCLAELWYKTTARKGPNVAGSSVAEKSPVNAGDTALIPGLGRSPGERNGNLLEKSMDWGACELQSMRSQRVRHDWATNTQTITQE